MEIVFRNFEVRRVSNRAKTDCVENMTSAYALRARIPKRETDRAGNRARSRDVENEREREGGTGEKKKNAPVEQLLRDSPEYRHVICVYERADA